LSEEKPLYLQEGNYTNTVGIGITVFEEEYRFREERFNVFCGVVIFCCT